VLEMAMIRWTDLIGVAGYAMVLLSTLLLFPDSAEHMNWKYWLAGLSLWFLGFASVVGWLLLRWSVRPSQKRGVTSDANGSHRRNEKTA
jgi:hypothetical protein